MSQGGPQARCGSSHQPLDAYFFLGTKVWLDTAERKSGPGDLTYVLWLLATCARAGLRTRLTVTRTGPIPGKGGR